MAQETKAAVSVDPFAGGGEMGALMRSRDWSQTPLGSVAGWPQSLRTALGILLASRQPMLMWWGPELIQLYNDAYRPILGPTKHPQALGQRAEDCWSEEWQAMEPVIQQVKTGESSETKDGPVFLERNGHLKECYFSYAYSPIRNDDGQINGVLCICREETAQVEMAGKLAETEREVVRYEQEMRQEAASAEQKVSTVLESISDAFVAFDQQWRYTYVNKKATELLNRSQEELIGNHVWENVFPERVGAPVYQELQRVLHEKVAAVFEIFDPVLESWVEAHAYPSADGVCVYFHDISDRKTNEFKRYQAEAELREAHIQLESALLAGAVYTWRWNIPKDRVRVNAAFAHLYGVDVESATKEGLPIENFSRSIHEADRDRVSAAIQRALTTGEVYTAEYRVWSADGRERWVRARGQVEYDAAGNPFSFPGAVIDITDRKHAEAERDQLLAQAQAAQEAAESANRVKDEFLAVVSHELRSPLNPILGWSQMLRKRQLSEEKTAYALETIERNAKMQAQLINDLLDVSRILRGKLSLEAASVDLADVVHMSMETVRLAADVKSIQIETYFDPAVGPVSGDPGRLQQVVWNLLSNAVKFTPEGGKVSVGLVQLGNLAKMTVSDTGKGIEPDFLPHVFERFHQADAATTRHFGGLGLGLAIVRSLVELHGGTIEAESAGENRGATFTVTLPVIPHPTVVEPVALPVQSVDLSGVQVLVVDDDENARELMSCLLEMHGAITTITASAGEAITALAERQPDIILSDIGMPDVDGYMLMRQVRALPSEQGGEIPAIALTAYASEIDHRQSAAAGFQQHVAKPIEAEALVGVIARLVNR
ncbi:MAG: ATP-binding protein [Phormidesmis sp.]